MLISKHHSILTSLSPGSCMKSKQSTADALWTYILVYIQPGVPVPLRECFVAPFARVINVKSAYCLIDLQLQDAAILDQPLQPMVP